MEKNDLKSNVSSRKEKFMINEFRGKYYFLSNFFEIPITWDGITYRNNEAAFQSAKVLDMAIITMEHL